MLEYSNVEVLRRNHVGDWGTQFGTLIEYLFEKFPNLEVVTDQAIGDHERRFDSDPGFEERAQQAVGGEEKYCKAWAQICEVNGDNGFSFFDYLSLYIYVTNVGQRKHFEMFFTAAKHAGWLPVNDNMYPKASHVHFADEWTEDKLVQIAEAVGYGVKKDPLYSYKIYLMMGNTAVYLLCAHARICSIIRKSGKDTVELKKEHARNFTSILSHFSILIHLHLSSGYSCTGTIVLGHPDEHVLGLHLRQFAEVTDAFGKILFLIVEETCTILLPNVLCEYLYNL
ncbi:hypothetical protein LOK49_LG03G01261 [Camellia lanceoleosa]|uniref:Uncharacterized protein n=1 Tax=Camellia lanceoleosa TaxID=1840588 RepID=A0ACC0IAB4_9ERIC|nr:hypothetical protein LOK49_LG03G01261 [Camellia lanceoleosa]